MGLMPGGLMSGGGRAGGALSGRALEALGQAAGAIAAMGGAGAGDICIETPTDGAPGPSPFDRVIDGLNRLPRPFLAIGTLGLFVYAMAEPEGFAARMRGLAEVPEPLWWLFGAVVSFHFGAREAHYHRIRRSPPLSEGGAGSAGALDGDRMGRSPPPSGGGAAPGAFAGEPPGPSAPSSAFAMGGAGPSGPFPAP